MNIVEHADMLEAIPRLVAEGVVCDAIVTDPPYNLEAMAKRFGPGQKAATSPDHQRFAKGFMGMTWDSDVALRPETWATVTTILRPGAFLVAFGGTRTYHRLACAIEDGGFVIQDCIMWLFGTGFPKRRDMLKPAYEPIVLAYKPGGKRTMQIDECRIDGAPEATRFDPAKHNHEGWRFSDTGADTYARAMGREGEASAERRYNGNGSTDMAAKPGPRGGSPLGRWPANVCHDGSDEVRAAFPDSAGQRGEVTGTEPSKALFGKANGHGLSRLPRADGAGSAARFFFSAKAGAQDRWGSRHPTVKPVELMKWLAALVCPPGGLLLDPFAGSGTTGVAALATGRNAILIERDDTYVADIRERTAHYEGAGRHSLVAKARRQQDKPLGGLFERPYDKTADALPWEPDDVYQCCKRALS